MKIITINFFFKQSRRDKTHEVLITPHKAKAAVWGLTVQFSNHNAKKFDDYFQKKNCIFAP
jgi:hypothetical protein